MVNVGTVERAAEPRTLGRATGHEPECTYLGTDVKGCRVRFRLDNVSTTGVDFRGSKRTPADSLLPEKPPAVRDFAGKRVRRRGLVSLQSYTFKSCLPDQVSRRNCKANRRSESCCCAALLILDPSWTTIAGAHFREQCPLSRRRADPGPSRPEPGAPGSTRAFSRARMSSRCGSRPLSATSSTRALG